MKTAPPVSFRLEGISPKAYEHPADSAATAALHAIPALDKVVERLIEFGYERAYRQVLLASSVKLGPDQLPDVWQAYETVLTALDMPEAYDLYITQAPIARAFAIGSRRPMIVVSSGAEALLDRDELRTALAHELGHILSGHLLYRTALLVLLSLGSAARLPVAAGLPLMAVTSALLEWSRATELSADRAATLATRDPVLTCQTLMVLAGGAGSRRLNVEAFMRQASEYAEWDSGWDRIARLRAELGRRHGYPVRRVSELMRWVRSGDYDRIVGGDYAKRGDPVDPRAHAGAAVRHYRERFSDLLGEAEDSFVSAADRLIEWLRPGPPA